MLLSVLGFTWRFVRSLGEALASALPAFSLDIAGIVVGYALWCAPLLYTAHQSSDVLLSTPPTEGDPMTFKCVRKFEGDGLAQSFGLWVHAGLLYVGSWGARSCIRVFNVKDGSFVKRIGDGIPNEPVGVTVVAAPD